MLARELADAPFAAATLDADAEAARTPRPLGARRPLRPVLTDDSGLPHPMLAGTQMRRVVVSTYVQEDPTLARLYEEKHAGLLSRKLVGSPPRTSLRAERTEPPTARRDATAVELAAVLARVHPRLVAAVDDGRLLGVATAGRLADRMLP